MGGRRLTPGQGVDALEEAIDLMRLLWAQTGRVSFAGKYYTLERAATGPVPAHDVGIWIGAYKPRMLALTGRKGDGWLPSLPYLQPGDLASGNAAIDAAAVAAGRDPSAIRRMLNLPLPDDPVAEFTRLAREERVDTFLVMADDPAVIEALGEIAAAVRAGETPAPAPQGLGVTPTPAPGVRVGAEAPWDESARPHREPPLTVTYTERGRASTRSSERSTG
jgi:alkanesulfonate monooxygenase SsuD/methylene tetrahydromethanopterin reductase-like flavin-dependent oxidoreductase (luciferase family)